MRSLRDRKNFRWCRGARSWRNGAGWRFRGIYRGGE